MKMAMCLSTTSTFSEEQKNSFRLLISIDTVARPVMLDIFNFGAETKKETENLEVYLLETKKVRPKKYKDVFKNHKSLIENDPSCQSFDITLLYHAIQFDQYDTHGNDISTEDELKLLLQNIKDFRNSKMHSVLAISNDEFLQQMKEFKDLLMKTINAAGIKFCKDVSDLLHKTNANMNSIRDDPLTEYDLQSYNCTALFNTLKMILLEEGIEEMKSMFNRLTHINPASMIVRSNIRLQIDKVFSALEIVQRGLAKHKKKKQAVYPCKNPTKAKAIDHTNFISYSHSVKKPDGGQFILIEGVAGVGKTTLIRFLISDWISKETSVEQLDNYDFIIPIECRSRSKFYESFDSVLVALMPKAAKHFQKKEHMRECLLEFKSLIILDGLDEFNKVSLKLFYNVLEILKSSTNITVICTTRPEKVNFVYREIQRDDITNIVHIKIKGISRDCMERFIIKYHDELVNMGESEQSTDELLKYFITTSARLKDHWTLPLNLSLLCLLWAVDPNRVNHITTPVELLIEIQKLSTEKLIERLQKRNISENLDKNIQIIRRILSIEALVGIKEDAIVLQIDAMKRLRDQCDVLTLSYEEVLGAFMEQKHSWLFTYSQDSIEFEANEQQPDFLNSSTYTQDLHAFPHKASQEFFASLCVYEEMFVKNRCLNTDCIINGIQNLCYVNDVSFKITQEFVEISRNYFSGQIIPTECTISSTFKSILGLSIEESSIMKYQNTFILLLGLFYYEDDRKPSTENVKELIDILIKAGVDTPEQWISVLNGIKCNKTVTELIVQHQFIWQGKFEIEDNSVNAYYSILKEIDCLLMKNEDIEQMEVDKPENCIKLHSLEVDISIEDNPLKIERLLELLQLVMKLGIEVDRLEVHHLYRNPSKRSNLEAILSQILSRCKIATYLGPMTAETESIPESMKNLCVSLTDGDSFNVFQRVHRRILLSNSTLEDLEVCLSADFEDLDKLSPVIGKHQQLNIRITDVSEYNWRNVCKILLKLHHEKSKKQSKWIKLHGTTLTCGIIENICGSLHKTHVTVDKGLWLQLLSDGESADVKNRLNMFVQDTLKWKYGIKWKTEKEFWEL